MSEESVKTPATLDKSFTAKLTYVHNSKVGIKFEEKYWKQDKVSLSLLFINKI